MKLLQIIEQNKLSFVQDCSANNIHIAKDGKAACNSRFRVFAVEVEDAISESIGCTRCVKQLQKLGA